MKTGNTVGLNVSRPENGENSRAVFLTAHPANYTATIHGTVPLVE